MVEVMTDMTMLAMTVVFNMTLRVKERQRDH
jgi:hypothetical protein